MRVVRHLGPYFVLSVICILEASGKWPEDVGAIKRLKAAFHIKMAELLQSHYKLTVRPHATHINVVKVSVACYISHWNHQ